MAGGVSVADIYHELIGAGASTVQALGIMANMINESGFNPEAVGDQGTSFGLVQQHGNYGYLVTGNPAADMKRQITALKSLGGFSAASGGTPAEAAGNFAANYERCVGCQPGGAQYNSRVANAAKVLQYFKTGKWPNVPGGSTPGGSPDSTPAAPADLTAFRGFPPPSILAGPQGIMQYLGEEIGKLFASPFTGAAGIAGGIEGVWKAITVVRLDLEAILADIEWLFQPSHWIRVSCFILGTALLIPGLVKLGHAGQGDMSLAIGILLTTLAAILYFIAFHNLPPTIKDLRSLLGYFSDAIRGEAPKMVAT